MPPLEMSPDCRAAGERDGSSLPKLRHKACDPVAIAGTREGRLKRSDTPAEILQWLTAYACRVHFQELNSRVLREKNRVVIEYRVPSGPIATCGGHDLPTAVIRAATRLEFTV